jgi:hypothetical protein
MVALKREDCSYKTVLLLSNLKFVRVLSIRRDKDGSRCWYSCWCGSQQDTVCLNRVGGLVHYCRAAYIRQPVRSRHTTAGRDYYRSHLLFRGCRWLTMTPSLAARDGQHRPRTMLTFHRYRLLAHTKERSLYQRDALIGRPGRIRRLICQFVALLTLSFFVVYDDLVQLLLSIPARAAHQVSMQ